MVGWVLSPAIEGASATEEEKENCKLQSLSDSKLPSYPSDPLDLCLPELEDLPDSFLDFDSIHCWFAEGGVGMADLGGGTGDFGSGKGELGASEVSFEVGGDSICRIGEFAEDLGGKEGSSVLSGTEIEKPGIVQKSLETSSEVTCEKIQGSVLSIGDESNRKLGDPGSLIEDKMGKVSLNGVSNCSVLVFASDHAKTVRSSGTSCTNAGGSLEKSENVARRDEIVSDEDDSESDEGSEDENSSSSSSSSSSPSSSDEEDKDDENRAMRGRKNKNKAGTIDDEIEVEEGEITPSMDDKMTITFSDDEDADDDVGVTDAARPITSKNEIKALPPVPPVTVTLQPHHQTMVVGTILSMIGPQVIVEGVEKHSPLNEGSILWINETRLPLGIVDEIFGPVKNPYYIVRYNSENEVPPGIDQGTVISFVPEFASHILNDKNLYQKGYDASGENDEELSNELEFSDDEKEAEYRRMVKMKKRGINESKPPVNKRKERRHQKSQYENWNRNWNPTAQTPLCDERPPANRNQQSVHHPVVSQSNNQTYPCSSGLRQDFAADPAIVPPFSNNAQAPPAFSTPNRMWSNGFPPPQLQTLGLPGGLPPNGMLWMQQNQPVQLFQNPFQTNFPIQQQISSTPTLPSNFNTLGAQSDFGSNPPSSGSSWPTCLDQNILNVLQLAMSLQVPQNSLPLNGGGEAFHFQSTGSDTTNNMQPSPGILGTPHHFNQGRGGGRRGRGGGHGRSGGMRGRYQGH